jgi:hypothetical protein
MLSLIPTFAVFSASFLLFLIQPMVGKLILPTLGGTPMVWNTAMLFFQVLLLLGYLYAFLITKLQNIKLQGIIHLSIMLLACASLPLSLPNIIRDSSSSPLLWQILIMSIMVGAPFFILSSSAPLIQKWFSQTDHKDAENPYFLYAASNIGSLLALLIYPFIVEPLSTLTIQKNLWSLGFVALIIIFSYTIYIIHKSQKNIMNTKEKIDSTAPESISWKRRFLWVFLAFLPSSMMLGYTQFITTDIAAIPLFWVVPLALYLLTFIISFSTKPFFTLPLTRILQTVFFLMFVFLMITNVVHAKWILLFVHGALFFFTALMCHQEMVALRPSAKRLTEFYLLMSLGGALGGVFNSLIAPQIFILPYEYTFIILLTLWVRFASQSKDLSFEYKPKLLADYKTKDFIAFPGLMILAALGIYWNQWYYLIPLAMAVVFYGFQIRNNRLTFALTMSIVMLCHPPIDWQELKQIDLIERNFFGVIRIKDDPRLELRTMAHGTTTHGAQSLDQKYKTTPLSYYHPNSGAGDLFSLFDSDKSTPQHIAALGLGTGSVTCYNAPNRDFSIYEIDPDMVKISQTSGLFTYLKDCGSRYSIKLGDARQEIQKAPSHFYDMIFVDVFSSDNIPVHVMTVEAIATYLKNLKPDGIIAIHTSNRFFNLNPEIVAIARANGLVALERISKGGALADSKNKYYPTNYTAMTKDNKKIIVLQNKGWTIISDDNRKPWSDDFVNLLRAFRLN